jgi:serine/threonine protein kinase
MDYIVAHGRLQERDARRFFRQTVAALDYCHSLRVIRIFFATILFAKDSTLIFNEWIMLLEQIVIILFNSNLNLSVA